MTPVSRSESYTFRDQALFVYGGGLAIGLHVALIHVFLFRTLKAVPISLSATLVHCTAILILWRMVFPQTGVWPTRWRFAVQIAVSIWVFALLSVAFTELSALLTGSRSLFAPYDGGDRVVTIPAYMYRWGPLVYTAIPVIPTALLCVMGFNQHWWRIFVLEGKHRELRDLAVAAQLSALRAQINPHFFFNSLNSIAQLISSDPEKAERCVERLADIYRYILGRSQAEFVSLADELAVAEAYLEIEKARFGDDLQVEERIGNHAREVHMPGLLLQPLVENAVRHGISRKIGGGTVCIEADIENGHLRLTVRDTGAGILEPDTVFERGVGLRSVHDRLVRLYGPAYVPVLDSASDRGTSVTIRIPLRSERLAA